MKTKITTIASTLVIGLLILPSLTFAVWWNPFTWFNNWGKGEVKKEVVVDKEVPFTKQTKKPVVVDENASSTKRLSDIKERVTYIEKEMFRLQAEQSVYWRMTTKLTSEEKLKEEDLGKQVNAFLDEDKKLQAEYKQIQSDLGTKLSSNASGVDVNSIYNKYCSDSVSINYKNTDYSSGLTQTISSLKIEDLANNLVKDGLYSANQVPEALQYLGLKLMQGGKVDDSIKLYQCAAERYYDAVSMYRMASVYGHGTDSIQSQLPNAVINNKIAVDYSKAYYWITSYVYVAKLDHPEFLDAGTQLGWNSIAMLDDLQNTGKVSDSDMKSIEQNVIQFVAKRYPSATNVPWNVYSHGMNGFTGGSTNTSASAASTGTESTSNSSLVLDSKPYVDTKNGFSITPPAGWAKDVSSSRDSSVSFKSKNGVIDVISSTATNNLSKYADDYVSRLKSRYSDFVLTSKKTSIVSGKNAYVVSGTFSFNSNKFRVNTLMVEGDNTYQLEAQSTDSTWAQDGSSIMSSLSSFKFN